MRQLGKLNWRNQITFLKLCFHGSISWETKHFFNSSYWNQKYSLMIIAWVIQNNHTLQCTCITNKISISFLYFYFQNNHCKKKTTSILYPYYTYIDAVNTEVKMTKKKIITVTAICVHVFIKVYMEESNWRN